MKQIFQIKSLLVSFSFFLLPISNISNQSVPILISPTPQSIYPVIFESTFKPPTPEIKGTISFAVMTREEIQKSIVPVKIVVSDQQLDTWFSTYSSQYGVSKDLLVKIAKCESGFNPSATNGAYGGMFQFSAGTFSGNRTAMGEDPNPSLRFNPEESIKTAAYKISRDGSSAWPTCSK